MRARRTIAVRLIRLAADACCPSRSSSVGPSCRRLCWSSSPTGVSGSRAVTPARGLRLAPLSDAPGLRSWLVLLDLGQRASEVRGSQPLAPRSRTPSSRTGPAGHPCIRASRRRIAWQRSTLPFEGPVICAPTSAPRPVCIGPNKNAHRTTATDDSSPVLRLRRRYLCALAERATGAFIATHRFRMSARGAGASSLRAPPACRPPGVPTGDAGPWSSQSAPPMPR
jgi:hypothetical protein